MRLALVEKCVHAFAKILALVTHQDKVLVLANLWLHAMKRLLGGTQRQRRVACDKASEINGLIEKHTQHWRMERMAAVDRNILREAVAEFLGYPQTPKAVVINEALEIARKFSTPESVQFINGVLDSVGKELG